MEEAKTKILKFRRNEIKIITEGTKEDKECWWSLEDLCRCLKIDLIPEKESLEKIKMRENESKIEQEELMINLAGLEKLIDYCDKEFGSTIKFCQWMIEKAFPSIWEEKEEKGNQKDTTRINKKEQITRKQIAA
jgi:prophage antirepressor-like protein